MLLAGINNSRDINIQKRLNSNLTSFILLFFLVIWILGFLQPLIFTQNNFVNNYFLERIYSRVCHQESSKCILTGNGSMLVCARCAGIYLGALFTALIFIFISVPELRIKLLMIALIPMLLDVGLTFLGVYKYSQTIAFSTGLVFGGIVYVFLLSELENLISNKSIKRNE